MKKMKWYPNILLALLLTAGLASCSVHEFPEFPDRQRVVLTIAHRTEWTEYDHVVTRGIAPENTILRYHLVVTLPDDPKEVVDERVIYTYDHSRPDFTTELELPAGDYSIWAWSDHAHPDSKESVHFDTSDFSEIVYSQPYSGNDDRRDAFRGTTLITVKRTPDPEEVSSAVIELERPLAKYRFIATDLAEFVENEITRGALSKGGDPNYSSALQGYRVKMIYTGYMPSKFNNFINRPVDSAVGMSYEGTITPTGDSEALLSFDYVMVNGHESSIPVAVEVYDGDALIASVPAVNVPIVRSRLTTVRGKFLTSQANEGVGIDPGFDGDYNIEVK